MNGTRIPDGPPGPPDWIKATNMKYLLPIIMVFTVLAFADHGRAAEEPTRPMDIEFDETVKRRFTELNLSFAAERIFYDTNGNLVVHGTIVNHSTFTVDRVVIDCTARGTDGFTVASTRTHAFPNRLRPAQKGLVKFTFARTDGTNIDKVSYALSAHKPMFRRDAEQIGESLRYLPDTEASLFWVPLFR